MRQYIHVTKETREFLSKAFGIEPRTVYNALNFVKDNDLAKRVRKLAYEKGGILMCLGEWMETFHDHDNIMRQYLPNGVLLEFDKNDGSGDVYHKGRCVRHYENLLWSDIKDVQAYGLSLR